MGHADSVNHSIVKGMAARPMSTNCEATRHMAPHTGGREWCSMGSSRPFAALPTHRQILTTIASATPCAPCVHWHVIMSLQQRHSFEPITTALCLAGRACHWGCALVWRYLTLALQVAQL